MSSSKYVSQIQYPNFCFLYSFVSNLFGSSSLFYPSQRFCRSKANTDGSPEYLNTMAFQKLSNNRAVKTLEAARHGRYGVLGVVVYNMETLIAIIKAAEAKRSPVQVLLFPWAYKYSPLFIDFCTHACRKASVPVTIHMDHAQDPEVIRQVVKLRAEDGTPAFDSIMVDMSHYDKEEKDRKSVV